MNSSSEPPRRFSRSTALGYLSANLALPGLGSIMAGRVVGYCQAAVALAGLGLTLGFGTRFIVWYFANWSRLQDLGGDPIAGLIELWLAVRWALLGIGLFVVAILWALTTSYSLVREASTGETEISRS